MKPKDSFTWEQVSEIVHSLRAERVVIRGIILRMTQADLRLEELEQMLSQLILEKDL